MSSIKKAKWTCCNEGRNPQTFSEIYACKYRLNDAPKGRACKELLVDIIKRKQKRVLSDIQCCYFVSTNSYLKRH